MSRYHGEQVLVVPRAAFEEAGYFQGHREGGDHYLNVFMKPGVASFMDREAAENDPSHKQIIAYAMTTFPPIWPEWSAKSARNWLLTGTAPSGFSA